jgi:hypothetical protein
MFGWEPERAKIIRGAKISLEKKLESFRLMNELSDRVLTIRQKLTRRRLREGR